MDAKNQIQIIKSQIMNIKLSIDNMDLMMNNTQIGELLINLSIQMLNTGIQTFNIGKNIIINYNKYVEQLNLISQQINILINENNNMIQQQQMMQQQVMIPPLMMGQNYMNMYMNQPLNSNEINRQKKRRINAIFKTTLGNTTNIAVEEGTTVEELLNQYINRINMNFPIKTFYCYNTEHFLKRTEQKKVEDILGMHVYINIRVDI